MNEVDTNARIVWDYMQLHHKLVPADAIFALGSNDLRVAERAADLYIEQLAPYVICAGGNGKASDFGQPEAEEFAAVLMRKGVSEDKIILEKKSTNTGENILFVRELLKETGHNFSSFILVQKPYMERRTYATFRKQWPEAECVVTSPKLSYEEYTNDRVFKERFLHIMVGDFQRIKEYPAKGFQIPQEMPKDVWEAYENLVALGYTKYAL